MEPSYWPLVSFYYLLFYFSTATGKVKRHLSEYLRLAGSEKPMKLLCYDRLILLNYSCMSLV